MDKMNLVAKFNEHQTLVMDFFSHKYKPKNRQEYLDKRNALEAEIKALMDKLKLAPRVCSECGKPMWEGFYDDNYYCSEKCLHKHYTPEEWIEAYDDGEGEAYWTEWYVDDIDEDIIIALEDSL
jgi:hypothetical protein